MAPDKQNISIRIESAVYHITVNREDEPLYREAEHLVNSRLNNYAQKLPGRSSDEYLRMMTLDIALAFVRNRARNDTEPYAKSMEQLTLEIEDKLKEKKS